MKRGPTGFSSWLELKDPEIDPGLFHSHGVMPSKAKAGQGKAAWRSKAVPTRTRRSSPKAGFRKLAQDLGACPHRSGSGLHHTLRLGPNVIRSQYASGLAAVPVVVGHRLVVGLRLVMA